MRHGRRITYTWGGVVIRGLWESQTDANIDIIFGDADADPNVKDGMDTYFPIWGKMSKYKHGGTAMSNGHIFFVCSLS